MEINFLPNYYNKQHVNHKTNLEQNSMNPINEKLKNIIILQKLKIWL